MDQLECLALLQVSTISGRFSLLLSAENGEESSCVTCYSKEITQPRLCVSYVGVAMDKHSTVLIKVSVKQQRYLTEELG